MKVGIPLRTLQFSVCSVVQSRIQGNDSDLLSAIYNLESAIQNGFAGVAKLADARDLKSLDPDTGRAGSTPAPGIMARLLVCPQRRIQASDICPPRGPDSPSDLRPSPTYVQRGPCPFPVRGGHEEDRGDPQRAGTPHAARGRLTAGLRRVLLSCAA